MCDTCKGKYYITTPIYYPSDRLHIGHSTLEKWPDKALELGLLTAAEIDEIIKFRDQHRKGGTRRKPYAEDQTDQNGQI